MNFYPKYFICVLIACIPMLAIGQIEHYKFEHLQTDAGLSQSNVLCILNDSRGFMWFGTRDGLNKYDGYKFTVYKNDINNKKSISNNYIPSIIEDKSGELWMATWGGGLNRFHRNNNSFESFKHDPKNPNSIASDAVTNLLEDNDGKLWVGTEAAGVDLYDPKKNTFIHFRNDPNNAASIADNFIRAIYKDHNNNVWIGTVHGGLQLYDRKTKSFIRFQHSDQNERSISADNIYSIFEDSRHRLWIGTDGGGLNLFNPSTQTFERIGKNSFGEVMGKSIHTIGEDKKHNLWIGTENEGLSIMEDDLKDFVVYKHDYIDNTSVGSNSIYSICQDKKGNMWVGSFTGGIDFLNIDKHFYHYKHSSSSLSLSDNNVLSIFEDSKKRIWIGTDGGGLNMMDPEKGTFKHFVHEEGNRNTICGDYVLSICEDKDHNFWIGTWADGITVFNPEKNIYTHFKNDPKNASSLASNNAWKVFSDLKGNIWVGTYGGGLDKFNPVTQSFIHYPFKENDSTGVNTFNVNNLWDDGKGNLWAATTGGGVNVLNLATNTFKYYRHNDSANSVIHDNINCLYEDSKGTLWIGTRGGLSMLDRNSMKFTNYTINDGLPNNVVFSILEDDKQNLWISTNKGLSCFNPLKKTFKNYGTVDGLQGDEFKSQAVCKSSSKAFYFGGNNGFNVFFPDSINQISYDPPLLITNFRIFNKEVAIGGSPKDPSPLKKDISESSSITIPYSSSVIEFEFASLNYTSPEKKKYAYMLDGFDKTWNEVGQKRTATYTHLDPGNYVFKVKGLTNTGEWSTKITELKIYIAPPFWLTWWFKLLVVVIVAGSCIAFYRIRINAVYKQKIALQKKVDERTIQLQLSSQQERKAREEAEKARLDAEAANKAKSVFLATMSHEIRTPMNGVIGMASLLAETHLTSEQQQYTETIKHSGEALLNVINDILDFSKIESGKMELEETDFDLRTCVEEVLDIFSVKASEIGIDLIYQIDCDVPLQMIGDPHRLRQVLINLVGNAIKFTKKGEIFVTVHLRQMYPDGKVQLKLDVRDTGIGIPADKLNKLFKPFSQVDSSTTRKYGGTGLGLVICSKLVELMGGTISVQSEEAAGTTFSFTIQVARSVVSKPTYVNNNLQSLANKRVLIIDDNQTNRVILKNQLLQWKFVPVLASSGVEALNIIDTQPVFDLIITDMQMPIMDGVEVAEYIRAKNKTLPVIVLSSIGDERCRSRSNLFAAVLLKPIKQQTLLQNILDVLRNQTEATPQKKDRPTILDAAFAQQHPLHILLVEDDVVNQKLATKIFNKLGYHTHLAKNGKEAVSLSQKDNYDIIFMDIQMPEMDGFEATGIIRNTLTKQPFIIAMTANAMQGDRQACLTAGMNDYISKPVKFTELLAILTKWHQHIQANTSATSQA